jgi:hypothetical protein
VVSTSSPPSRHWEFLTDWLRAIEPTVRPSTFDSYSRNASREATVAVLREEAVAANPSQEGLATSAWLPSA